MISSSRTVAKPPEESRDDTSVTVPKSGIAQDLGETKPVQMRLRVSTLQALSELEPFFETSNRTDIVARCIRLTRAIQTEIDNGGTIEVKRTDGTRCQLMFQ